MTADQIRLSSSSSSNRLVEGLLHHRRPVFCRCHYPHLLDGHGRPSAYRHVLLRDLFALTLHDRNARHRTQERGCRERSGRFRFNLVLDLPHCPGATVLEYRYRAAPVLKLSGRVC
jgi:hypothetical protein